MRLKSLKVSLRKDGSVEVVPQFYGPKGSTITRSDLKTVGTDVRDAVRAVMVSVGRGQE